MAYSGTVGTTVINVQTMIDHAARRCGKLAEELTSEQIVSARESLFFALSALINKGINYWAINKEVIGLKPNKYIYKLPIGAVDALNVLYRTMTGKGVSTAEKRAAQKLFFMTGMQLAALNVLYTALVTGDDEYEGLDEFVRNRNYIIPGTGVKIPVAPEVGLFFKVIPDRFYG